MNLDKDTFPQGVLLPKTIVDGLGATRVLPTRARVMLKHRECATHTLPSEQVRLLHLRRTPSPLQNGVLVECGPALLLVRL